MLLLGAHLLRLKKKKSWKKFPSSVNKDTPISKLHRMIDKISGKKVLNHVPTLSIGDEMMYDTKDVVNALAKNIRDFQRLLITIVS